MKKFIALHGGKIFLRRNDYSGITDFTVKKIVLSIEFIVVYLIIPVLIYLKLILISKMNILIFLSLPALLILLGDQKFDKKKWMKFKCSSVPLIKIAVRYLISFIAITLLMHIFVPGHFFHNSQNSLSILVISALSFLLLSVVPQEVLYRAFLFHRYSLLFRGKLIPVVISSLSFSFVHIVYSNLIAMIITLIGGYFFSLTYLRTRSLLITVIEHFMYGMLIFTSGLVGVLS